MGPSAVVNEHPHEPKKAEDASIWRLPFVSLGAPAEHWQGLFGGVRPKPTDLLFAYPSPATSTIAKKFQSFPMSRNLEMKREANGFYSTAKLKEYPGAFCSFLAEVFHSTVAWTESFENLSSISSEALEVFEAFQVTFDSSAQIFGPDYAVRS